MPQAVTALLWVRVLNAVGSFAIGFLAVLAGPGLTTAALAVFGGAALVSRWGGAILLDRMAPRGVLVLGLAATGVALAALTAARTPGQILLATAATGLAFEIYEPATTELLARLTPEHLRETVFRRFGTWLVAAGAVAGMLAAVLLPLGVRWLIAVDAATCLASAAVARVFLPAQPRPRTEKARRRWRPPASLVLLTGACTAYALGYLALVMFTPSLLLQRGAPAWLPGATLTGAALLAPSAGWLAQRVLRGRPHLQVLKSSGPVLAVPALAMAVTREPVALVAGYVCWSAVNAALMGRWPALVAEIAPERDRPRWFAFSGSSWGVAQPLVPGVVALVSTATGNASAPAPLTAAPAFLAISLILLFHPRPSARPAGAQEPTPV
ncbi:MFS transporter [Sphaerisporangium fuscum]|uniref:MFS transporter n=1 Tax=Sphaerisporangium fuscum TaxID=2835868 RepID=UPI001BDDC38D|nr:MFS transporter [Sphaerisporangium fuscum]